MRSDCGNLPRVARGVGHVLQKLLSVRFELHAAKNFISPANLPPSWPDFFPDTPAVAPSSNASAHPEEQRYRPTSGAPESEKR